MVDILSSDTYYTQFDRNVKNARRPLYGGKARLSIDRTSLLG